MKRKLMALAAGMGAAVILAPAASAQLYGGLGFKTKPFFRTEGEFSIGVQDESFDVLGTQVEVGLDSQYGVFAVGVLPLPALGDIFARAGYASISIDASASGIGSISEDGSGLAYGGGIMLNFIPFTKLRLEYTRYEPDDGEIDSFGISGLFHF